MPSTPEPGLPPRPDGAASWWQCVVRAADGATERFVVVESARYPDGMRVELPTDVAEAQFAGREVCSVRFDHAGRAESLTIRPGYAPKAPPLWFVERRESAARPPATSLMVFTGPALAAGRLIDSSDFAGLGLTGDDQVAAVRWYPASGEIDQIYVQPKWRRRHIASALLAAAGTLAAARDWARVWGDGQRTSDGEALRDAASWGWRAADLTHLAPSMTPPHRPSEP